MKIKLFAKIIFFFSMLFTQEAFNGYTLFSPQSSNMANESKLIDNDINTIHTWSHTNGPASMPYLVQGSEPGYENTILVYPYRVNNPTMESGGVGGGIQYLDWNGNILWNYQLSNDDYQHHHDVQPLPNGNVLMIAWERKYSAEWSSAGRASVDNTLNQMWSTAIFEIEPNLENGSSSIVWEWHLWDHLVQDRDPQYSSTFGEISEHPELMNINEGNVGSSGPGQANADWIHVNAIDYNERLDQIVLSSRFMGEIYIIDHSTTTEEAASHSGGNSGKGGDFLYRWGNPQNYDRGSNSDQQLTDQHSVNWIDEGCPGENNLILFNNRQANNQSAGVEFITPIMEDGNYFINDGGAFGPIAPIWIYHPGNGFHSQVQSGAFRLPNGNTLLTDADDSEFVEVSYDGTVVWEYDYPLGNNGMIARGQKYAIDYFDQEILLGDLNEDTILNILDVIILVNIALSNIDFNSSGDLNTDGIVNILDVVILVNVILN